MTCDCGANECCQCEVAETATWIDGPQFMAWLDEHHAESVLGRSSERCTWARRFYDWRRGSALQVWTADRLLTEIGSHLSLLPSGMFHDHDPRGFRPRKEPTPPELKELALSIHAATGSPTAAAQAIGVSPRTVHGWANS